MDMETKLQSYKRLREIWGNQMLLETKITGLKATQKYCSQQR
jgi:hypothetical protein